MTLFTVMARCRAWYRRQRKPQKVVVMRTWLEDQRDGDWYRADYGSPR